MSAYDRIYAAERNFHAARYANVGPTTSSQRRAALREEYDELEARLDEKRRQLARAHDAAAPRILRAIARLEALLDVLHPIVRPVVTDAELAADADAPRCRTPLCGEPLSRDEAWETGECFNCRRARITGDFSHLDSQAHIGSVFGTYDGPDEDERLV